MKMKVKTILFSSAFFLMLILPQLLFIPLRNYVDTENYENRTYQEKPLLSQTALSSYPSLYEAYFNDHLAFKNQFNAFLKLADIRIFSEVSSDAVLMGKDGWMFYKLHTEYENSLADYQGTNHFSSGELETFARLLDEANDTLSQTGSRLILYIVPNKEQVYSEYMPSSVRVADPLSRADLLIAYLNTHSRTHAYYPLEEFLEAKENWHQIYRKYDTHWNLMGAFLASQMLLCDMREQIFSSGMYTAYPVLDRGTFTGDLATMLSLHKYFDDDEFLEVSGYMDERTAEITDENAQGTITHYLSDAPKGSLFICRDSFGLHMAPYLAKAFREVTLADYRTEDCARLIRSQAPDFVIIEVAERYLSYMFPLLENLCTLKAEF